MRAIIFVAIVVLCVIVFVRISADPLARVRAAFGTGDYATVLNLLLPLAERGHARAQEMLGAMYANGVGVRRDYDMAARWSRVAADQGDAIAQAQRGRMYESGLGVPKDGAEAFAWYRLAADQGNALAQSALGAMYIDGSIVPIDVGKGLHWSVLAAEKGDSCAQVRAAVLFEQGIGTSQDYIQAHKWYNLAVASYVPSDMELSARVAAARDKLATKMAADQIAEAQRIVREWQQSHRT